MPVTKIITIRYAGANVWTFCVPKKPVMLGQIGLCYDFPPWQLCL